MLELRRYPFPGCFCRKVPADARLDVSLQFIKRNGNALLMRLPNSLVPTYERSKRYALRC